MDAGHGGGSGRTSERLEIAKVYAFILDLEGITK
jgi:oligopeptidase B